MFNTETIRDFFSNKRGKLVIWQAPNFLLWTWIATKILPIFIHDQQFRTHLSLFSKAVIFAWAYLELTQGDSKFRRALGLIVVVASVISLFS